MIELPVADISEGALNGAVRIDRNGDTVTIYYAGDVMPSLSSPPTGTPAVSSWQMRRALTQMGLRPAVEAAVAASDDTDVRDGWEYATTFERDNPMLAAMAAALHVSSAELDALFALAASF